MAEFKCEVVEIEVKPHPDADKLELAVVGGGINSIVPKGRYQTGDHVVYIPEAAIVPEPILEKLGLVGKLAGKNKNRVKPARLRGILSDGLIYPLKDGMRLGDDVTELLGVTKYEPEVPTSMSGEVEGKSELTINYDFSNFYRVPDIFDNVEEVVVTEKLHGSFTGITLHNGEIRVWSKGLGSKGIVFKWNDSNLEKNVYMRTLFPAYEDAISGLAHLGEKVMVFGETFGPGVQDLHYGLSKKEFRVFDLWIDGEFKSYDFTVGVMHVAGLTMVPELYKGPFDLDLLHDFAYGQDTLSHSHVREGIVIKAVVESRHPEHGRVIAKIVSDDYKSRKGGTEYS